MPAVLDDGPVPIFHVDLSAFVGPITPAKTKTGSRQSHEGRYRMGGAYSYGQVTRAKASGDPLRRLGAGRRVPVDSVPSRGTVCGTFSEPATPSYGSDDCGSKQSYRAAGSNAGRPTISERGEAWLSYCEQKRLCLRERCDLESGVGAFTPRLCQSRPSPRWLGAQAGGQGEVPADRVKDLHERGMRAKARKKCRQRQAEEEKFVEDMRGCPFRPDLSGSWPLPCAVLAPAEPDCTAMVGTRGGSPSASERSVGVMTPERAAKFYDVQLKWQETLVEKCSQLRDIQLEETLRGEALARERPSSARSVRSEPLAGVFPRTVYDRQILWRRQRDSEIEQRRQAQIEELTRPEAKCNRKHPSRRCRSAPGTPRVEGGAPIHAAPIKSDASGQSCGQMLVHRLRQMRGEQEQPREQRQEQPQRSRSTPSTPRGRQVRGSYAGAVGRCEQSAPGARTRHTSDACLQRRPSSAYANKSESRQVSDDVCSPVTADELKLMDPRRRCQPGALPGRGGVACYLGACQHVGPGRGQTVLESTLQSNGQLNSHVANDQQTPLAAANRLDVTADFGAMSS